MKTKLIVLWVGLMTIIMACGGVAPTVAPDQTALETMVAATLQTYTQEAADNPTQPSRIPISFQNISFTIPEGLATGAQSEIVQRFEDTGDIPYWSVAPEYVRFVLARTSAFQSNFDFEINVIPADVYLQMNEAAAERIPLLQQKLTSGDLSGITVLPPFNAGLVIDAQPTKVDFQNGSGIHAIQQYHQAPVPITNDYLIYTYQGITQDGKYYVSIVAPIHAAFLIDQTYNPDPNATTPTPIVPEGGFVFPDIIEFDNPEFEQYYQAVTEKLSQSTADQFTPSLSVLDALVQSILIQ